MSLVANVPSVYIIGPIGMCAYCFVGLGLLGVGTESERECYVADGGVIVDVLDLRLGHELGDFDSVFQYV